MEVAVTLPELNEWTLTLNRPGDSDSAPLPVFPK